MGCVLYIRTILRSIFRFDLWSWQDQIFFFIFYFFWLYWVVNTITHTYDGYYCRLLHINKVWRQWSCLMGQRRNLQNVTMWKQWRGHHQEDQECGGARETTWWAEVAEADWPAFPAHQMEEVQQRQHLPRRHQGRRSKSGLVWVDEDSDKEEDQRINGFFRIERDTPPFSSTTTLSLDIFIFCVDLSIGKWSFYTYDWVIEMMIYSELSGLWDPTPTELH